MKTPNMQAYRGYYRSGSHRHSPLPRRPPSHPLLFPACSSWPLPPHLRLRDVQLWGQQGLVFPLMEWGRSYMCSEAMAFLTQFGRYPPKRHTLFQMWGLRDTFKPQQLQWRILLYNPIFPRQPHQRLGVGACGLRESGPVLASALKLASGKLVTVFPMDLRRMPK